MRTDNWLVYEALQNERARRFVGSEDENDSDNKNENDEKARRGK